MGKEVKKEFSEKAKKDFEYIRRAIESNDEKAFAMLMVRYRRSVYHLVYKMIRNSDDAEDLTIEAFAKAFKNLEKFNPQYTFSTWLFRIATNHCIDFIRKKKLKTFSIDSAYSDDNGDRVAIQIRDNNLDPQEIAIRKQKIEIIQLIVTKLPPKYQKLVSLRYFNELSYNEIAEELDAPLGTVKAQLHRARELLHDIMKKDRDKI